jgi:nitroimidazol reductase NimA-like FMN-containing flavoprotein (pyridoxamine 5'-phosphate oxidase superfamily)
VRSGRATEEERSRDRSEAAEDFAWRNPAVCLEVEEGIDVAAAATSCEFGMRFRTVIGDVELVEDHTELARLLALFGPRYGAPDRPLPEAESQRTCVLRLRIRELAGKRSPA